MNLPYYIRRLTYQPHIVSVARKLHINRFLRDIYCRYAQPRNRMKIMSFLGTQALFNVNDPVELRIIEAISEKGYGEYHILEKLFESIELDDVVYDIGASIGTHTILMAKKVGGNGQIIAFEPERESYEELKANISLNNLKNVVPINVAVGDHSAEGVMYSYGDGYGAFNLLGYGSEINREKVEIVKGDLLIEEKRLPLPNVVKIDVEGYEYAVIRGLEKTLRSEKCKLLCCEIHPGMLPEDVKPEMITDLLKSCGFNRIETYPRGETYHAFCRKNLSPQ